MTLSNSRQQFLAYESQASEDIQYSRRGGVFVSTCVCIGLVIFAIVLAALVGVIVYFITYFKLTQKPGDFWDETEPFSQNGPPSPNLRLPSDVVPSFYRLKIKTDLQNSNFTGGVSITLRANKRVKEIVLHSKNLSISNNAKLTEQIYERVETLHLRRRRQADDNGTVAANVTEVTPVPDIAKSNADENVVPSDDTAKTPKEDTHANENVPIQENVVSNSNITVNENTQPNTNVPIIDANQTDVLRSEVVETSAAPDTTVVIVSNATRKTDLVQKPETPLPYSSTTSQPITDQPDTHTHVTHSSVRDIKIVSVTAAAGDRLILTLATPLKPDVDYILEIPFQGQISDSLTGFYKSSYVDANKETKSLAVTQFEPTSARSAFPCFDEPGFKAKFEISIGHQKNLTVLSNMKVATTEAISDQPGWQWTHFERSVNMSTYLVTYVISDFKSVDTSYISKDNVTKPIRIWTRPELMYKAKYAARITPILLEYYEHVFGVPYALDKLDMIAIPDFSSGAMENWGLITFRETTLLVDEENSVPRDKQNVAIDIAHELAHQWFGNLVTMQWWTDLWLNEGFASYIEYVGVDHIEPAWNMLETFSRDMLELLRTDALKNTSPVSRRVVDASEISQKFDEISYTKGANLIRMLNHTMTEELFHKGLVYYLDQWKYTNAEENDLWEAMSTAVSAEPLFKGRSLVSFMNAWTRQAGYPVVKVTRNYDSGKVQFEQRLFTSSKEPYKRMVNQLWQIPISYTTVDAPMTEWSTKPKLWLTERDISTSLHVNASQALYVNIGAIGYYRVNYDQRNWELLSNALQSGQVKSPITKAQLIDDAFNLAKANQLNYSYALGLTSCVINGEDSKIVWDLLLNNMGFLRFILKATSGYSYFQDYMKILIQKQLVQLNYGLDKPKDDNEAFLIENLVTWECMMESPRCLRWAKQEFENWISKSNSSDNPIPSYLRSLVYNMALRYGGRREFDFLWDVFLNSTDPNVKTLVITSLPSTRDEGLITMLLEKSLSEIPKQYAVAVWSVEPPLGTRIAQQFLFNNFQRVYTTFTDMDAFTFPEVLNGAFGTIMTQDELDQLKSFAIEHKDKLMPMSQTLQKIVDTAKLRLDWMQQHLATIKVWFEDYVTGKDNSATQNNASTTQPNSEVSPSLPVLRTSGSPSNITIVPQDAIKKPTTEEAVQNNVSENAQLSEGNPEFPAKETTNDQDDVLVPNTNNTNRNKDSPSP